MGFCCMCHDPIEHYTWQSAQSIYAQGKSAINESVDACWGDPNGGGVGGGRTLSNPPKKKRKGLNLF